MFNEWIMIRRSELPLAVHTGAFVSINWFLLFLSVTQLQLFSLSSCQLCVGKVS